MTSHLGAINSITNSKGATVSITILSVLFSNSVRQRFANVSSQKTDKIFFIKRCARMKQNGTMKQFLNTLIL